MAGLIDVGILKPELAGSFAAGYRGAEQARQQAAQSALQRQQAEQQLARGRQQMQMDDMTMKRLQEDRAAMLQLQERLKAAGQDPDLDKVFDALISTGNPDLVVKGTEGKQRLREQKEFARVQGLDLPGAAPVAAAPAAAAPVNALMAGPDQSQAEVNRLMRTAPPVAAAPAAPAAPAGASAAGATPELIAQTQGRINNLMRFAATASPQMANNALAQARILQDQLELYSKPGPATPAPSEVVKLNRELAAANAAGDTALAADLKARITRLTEKPVGTQVSVKLPPQQGAFESGLGKGQSERVLKDQEVAQDAVSIIDTVRQGRQLLQSGMITGFGAEALTQIGALLNQAGINFAEDAVANTQAFSANMAQNVGRIIKQFGAGTGLSNADREYAEKMAGGKITLDRKAIERILDINERAARNVIALHNKRVSGIKTNVPLTVDVPAGPPAPAPIPTAPPATAAPRPTARQVLRTGKLNGRKVVEYTDGSVEYAD